MKKIIKYLSIFIIVISWNTVALESTDYYHFVNGNIIDQNCKNFGLTSVNQLKELTFGKSISLLDISSEMINSGKILGIDVKSGQTFIPALIGSEVKFFLVIDKDGIPVSMGYKKLAVELGKISSRYSVDMNSIKLYQSLAINSYLFSVSTARSSNLTILKAGWDKSRSAALTPESETIEYLKGFVRGDR